MLQKIIISKIKSFKQKTNWSCGPASLRTIFNFYKFKVSEEELISSGDIGEEGTDHKTMRFLARSYGFKFYSKNNSSLKDIEKWLTKGCPIIVNYQLGNLNGENGHYSVIYGLDKDFIYIADPSNYYEGTKGSFTENKKMEIENFLKRWFDLEELKNERKGWMCIIRPKKNNVQKKKVLLYL